VIEDNGRGLPAPEARRTAADGSPGQVRGNGLINMNSRLQEIGGTCKLQTSSSGTSLKFTVPLKKTQPAH